MNIFIDTNVFLSFYHMTNEDLEELEKLAVLLQRQQVRLFLPTQVKDEFRRNREVKIKDAMKQFGSHRIAPAFPRMAKEYPEYESLKAALAEADRHLKSLTAKLESDIQNRSLKADHVISKLFSLATEVKLTDVLLSRARRRVVVGNPPGKNDSHGDAINWECLLHAVPADEDIYVISIDGDYSSPLDENQFHAFLLDEWNEQKKSRVIYYKRLATFFKDIFPNIRYASELEKELLIRELEESPTFARSRSTLQRLSNYSNFTPHQRNKIIEAAVYNNQIYWIIDDADIRAYLRSFVVGHEKEIDPGLLEKFQRRLEGKPLIDPDDWFDDDLQDSDDERYGRAAQASDAADHIHGLGEYTA